MGCKKLQYGFQVVYREGFSSNRKALYERKSGIYSAMDEPAHGAFNLYHTFSNNNKYPLTENSTDNLMDYAGGNNLFSYQWSLIHDPQTILFSFLQDEEEGEMGSFLVSPMIEAIRKANIDKKESLELEQKKNTTAITDNIKLGNKTLTHIGLKVGNSLAPQDLFKEFTETLKIDPREYSRSSFSYENDNEKYVKYEFHQLETTQLPSPYVNTTAPGNKTVVQFVVKASEANSFEEYLYAVEEVYIDGVNWISQTNATFNGETCWGPPNWCCCTASKQILSQFGVTPVNRICIAELSSPDDFSSVTPNGSFEDGLAVLETYIKPRDKGGEPILIGLHYPKTEDPGYRNTCTATFHYMVIVGKGYDSQKKQDYYRFYDVGRDNETDGANPQNRLYADKQNRTFSCTYRSKTYTITEIRSNH
jgi:hypothetical protein